MEVKGANGSMGLNNAASKVGSFGHDGGSKNQQMGTNGSYAESNEQKNDEPVMLSISAAGLRQSLLREREAEKTKSRKERESQEISDMRKKIEGLSSQVINGNFSVTDRNNFQNEIDMLTSELDKLNGEGIAFALRNAAQVSHRIDDLTRIISDAAVYRKNASSVFVIKNQQLTQAIKNTKLDIIV